jgi:hypothetical protein
MHVRPRRRLLKVVGREPCAPDKLPFIEDGGYACTISTTRRERCNGIYSGTCNSKTAREKTWDP